MRVKEIVLYTLGLSFCILPPLISTLLYFPLWLERGCAPVLSGCTLILIILSFIPLFRAARRALSTLSAHTLWFLGFILFFALSEIADEMTVICFFGFIGNLVGALLLRAARHCKAEVSDGEK